jgi:hypothetical protein
MKANIPPMTLMVSKMYFGKNNRKWGCHLLAEVILLIN